MTRKKQKCYLCVIYKNILVENWEFEMLKIFYDVQVKWLLFD